MEKEKEKGEGRRKRKLGETAKREWRNFEERKRKEKKGDGGILRRGRERRRREEIRGNDGILRKEK